MLLLLTAVIAFAYSIVRARDPPHAPSIILCAGIEHQG